MTEHLRRLAFLGSDAIGPEPDEAGLIRALGDQASKHILRLLRIKNGFYAFESALHVFPDKGRAGQLGLIEWNDELLWRGSYSDMVGKCVFFAEDVFGCQFCLDEESIKSFDPETGELETIADDIDTWAEKLLQDYRVMTGYPLAHSWQIENGALPVGYRLLPKVPFVLGGEFNIENLYALDAVEGMKFRASIASQIRDLPDGAKVVLKVTD